MVVLSTTKKLFHLSPYIEHSNLLELVWLTLVFFFLHHSQGDRTPMARTARRRKGRMGSPGRRGQTPVPLAPSELQICTPSSENHPATQGWEEGTSQAGCLYPRSCGRPSCSAYLERYRIRSNQRIWRLSVPRWPIWWSWLPVPRWTIWWSWLLECWMSEHWWIVNGSGVMDGANGNSGRDGYGPSSF